MASNKKYWKSVEELNPNSSIVEDLQQNEFVEPIPTDDFLGEKMHSMRHHAKKISDSYL